MYFKMNLLVFIVVLCSVCLACTQESISSDVSTPGPLSRLFSWLKKPNQKEETNEITRKPEQISKEDFSNPLPKASVDRMINDAISERILQESRQQQVIARSPFISENHENFLNNENLLNQDQLLPLASDREGYGKNMDTGNDKLPLTEALRIVKSSNLTDCVARVICELSCNANAYGNQGRIVFRNMVKLQFDQNIQEEDAKFFRQFAAKGRQIVQAKRDCKECYSVFPSCKSNSKDLIAVSSMFRL